MGTIDWSAWTAQEPDSDFAERVVKTAITRLDAPRDALNKLVAAQKQLERIIRLAEDEMARDEVSRLELLLRSLTDDHNSDLALQRMRRKQRNPLSASKDPPSIFEVGLMAKDAANMPADSTMLGAKKAG